MKKYIVLLKIPRVELGVEELNNILCYDENGKMCWRISNKLPSNIISKEQIPYVALQVIDEKLYATDFWGRKFNVDVESGSLIDFSQFLYFITAILRPVHPCVGVWIPVMALQVLPHFCSVEDLLPVYFRRHRPILGDC